MGRAWFYKHTSLLGFGAACLFISWAGLAAYWGTHRLVRSFDSAAESHRALEKLQTVQLAMESAEASVDAYVITGKAARLASFHEAGTRVPLDLKEMESLVAAYPGQVKALQPLERMTLGHLSYLRNVARVRRTRGAAAAASWIATEDSASPRALTRKLLADLKESESRDVKRRTASVSRHSTTAKLILTLAALMSLGFLGWAFTLWRRESRERSHAERERARLHSFLYSVIERIPYIVLVKEARALRVVHANQSAARWLGRSTEALVGANVFDWRPAKEAELEARQDRQALAAGQPMDFPEEQVTVGGQTRIFHTQKVMIPDADHQPAYLVTISEDITERKRAERMVELSRDAAVESARVKAEFLRNMTHEFRTPLSVIMGMSALLEGTTLAPDQRRFAGSVRKAAEGLSRMTKNILDFSKIETGSFQLENELVPLSETVESVLRMFAEQAAAKNLELTCACAGDVPPAVWGDRSRWRHVLTQLVGNAVKFTARGAVTVRVSVAKADAGQCWIACQVSDTGPGIAPEAQEHLFDAFRQGDGSATRRFGGIGIGLAIAKRIVELMGGEIGVENKPEGGSLFRVMIPFKKENSGETVKAAPLRILIIDENEIVRERCREQLSLSGLTSRTVAGGEAALTLLRAEQSSGRGLPVVLVGLHLLDMDGADFARAVRKDRRLQHLALITMGDQALDPAVALALGFTGSIAGNLSPAALYEALTPYMAAADASVGRVTPNLRNGPQ